MPGGATLRLQPPVVSAALRAAIYPNKLAVIWLETGVGGQFHGIGREMGVPGGRLDLGVAKQLADHGQPLASGDCRRGKRVPKFVDTDVLQSGTGADETRTLLGRYIACYNSRRPQSSLDRQTLLAAA